jgi:tetratricopeptide (TPR) repeat protein
MRENFNTLYKQISENISDNKIADAFIMMDPLIKSSINSDIKLHFDHQKETYKLYLDYKFKGISDPESSKIILNIQKQLIEIVEKWNDEFYLNRNTENIVQENASVQTDFKKDQKILETGLKELMNLNKDPESPYRKELLSKLFLLIWVSGTITESEKNALEKISTLKKIPNHEKCVLVSALTIGLIRRFDRNKFHLLFDFYDTGENPVWNRALTGIIMAYFVFEKRIGLYGDIISRLKLIAEDKYIQKHTENIILQFARSKETEKISKKLREEIIPEMQKFQPKIQDKLRLDEIISDPTDEDKNPDWEEIFDEAPGLLDKMADFSKLQLEGSDVFMSAFSMFKQFPFFKDTSNWFIPFYKENSNVFETFKDVNGNKGIDLFTEGLEKTAFMCNSDKYSFCMNIKLMPEVQRTMLLELFNREIEQMKEIGDEDEKLYKDVKDKHIFTQYIQDIYRFFKLHPKRAYFDDFFRYDTNFYNENLYEILISNEDFPQILGNLYFQKGFYSEALLILENLKLEGRKAQKNYEKIGYAYQKSNNFKNALNNYNKAEIYGDSSDWLVKQMAFCYRKNQDYENAVKYYIIAEKSDPENLQLQAGMGHCYLSLGNYHNALNKYFKVEFYNPDNVKVMKPIAWCSLMLGKFETAVKYYKKVFENKPDAYDLINYGHALYCSGLKQEAVEIYFKAIKVSNIETFEAGMNEDKQILTMNNVSESEYEFLIDFVKSNLL